jgi:hypothetical protein
MADRRHNQRQADKAAKRAKVRSKRTRAAIIPAAKKTNQPPIMLKMILTRLMLHG